MANRPLKRTVRIVLKSRDQADPLPILKAVEAAFRPSHVEIEVDPAPSDPDLRVCPNEPLETEARSYVANVLDRRDSEISTADPTATPKVTADASQVTVVKGRMARLRTRLVNLVAGGWKIAPKVLELSQGVATLVKSVEDVLPGPPS